MLGAGELVLSTASSMMVVIVLVVYFLAAMPQIRLFAWRLAPCLAAGTLPGGRHLAWRLAPQSRRARVILIGDEIFDKVGRYMLGNFLTSLIPGWAPMSG